LPYHISYLMFIFGKKILDTSIWVLFLKYQNKIFCTNSGIQRYNLTSEFVVIDSLVEGLGLRVQYKLGVTMHHCLQHKVPRYLVDCCTSVAEVPSHRHLRSANRQQLLVPRYCRSALGPRAFSVAGPRAWNALPDVLRDPTRSSEFPLDTQDIPIRWTLTACSALEADAAMRYRNLRLTLTLDGRTFAGTREQFKCSQGQNYLQSI